jgi:CxC1 like cysteine cluster associated with KDZ transposases
MDKRSRQVASWIEKTIPALVQPFLDLVQSSNNLRSIDRNNVKCSCRRSLPRARILCVEFASMHMRSICSCSISSNLVKIGFFPSTPTRPTVAFDIKMLSFMHELHVRCSPNISAWSSALETFLQGLGFNLASTDSLRRKIATSLRWYRFLIATKEVLVTRLIKFANAVDPEAPAATRTRPDADETAQTSDKEPPTNDTAAGDEWLEQGVDDPLTEPHEYLQEVCPLCFGGQCFDSTLM